MRSEAREQTRSALFGWIIIQSDMKISWIADQLSPETDALISPDWLCSYKLSIDKSRVWVQSDADVDLTGPVHTVTLKFICSLVDMVTTGVNPPGLMSQATSCVVWMQMCFWLQVISIHTACKAWKLSVSSKWLIFSLHAHYYASLSFFVLFLPNYFFFSVITVLISTRDCVCVSSVHQWAQVLKLKWNVSLESEIKSPEVLDMF